MRVNINRSAAFWAIVIVVVVLLVAVCQRPYNSLRERAEMKKWIVDSNEKRMYINTQQVKTVALYGDCRSAAEEDARRNNFKLLWDKCRSGQTTAEILRVEPGAVEVHFALPLENYRDIWKKVGQTWPDLQIAALDKELMRAGGERVEYDTNCRVGNMWVVGYHLQLTLGRYAVADPFRTG